MSRQRRARRRVRWLALALILGAHGAIADAVARRIANVERLIESSTGSRQIESSGSAEAMALHARARELLEAARAASRAGDGAQAGARLDEASRTMFEAVRLAGRPAALDRKRQDDFDRRRKSVEALLGALVHIGEEKGTSEELERTDASVRDMLGHADHLRAQGRVEEGLAVLGSAHDVAALQVQTLRGGDTLVRTLSFASKEEEYAYELDRNETHELLLRVLVRERGQQGGLNAMAERFVAEARRLRRHAEREAADGRFAAGVSALEESTGQLVRALRSSGIYIPG